MWMLLSMLWLGQASAEPGAPEPRPYLTPGQKLGVTLTATGGAVAGTIGVGALGAVVGSAVPERCFLICAGPIVGGALGGVVGGVAGGVGGHHLARALYAREKPLIVMPVVGGDRVGLVGAVRF